MLIFPLVVIQISILQLVKKIVGVLEDSFHPSIHLSYFFASQELYNLT